VIRRIDELELARGVRALARRDADLRSVVERIGPPPLWEREPGFPTLVQIILEQQVSLASGRAAYARLLRAAGRVTPRRIASLHQGELRAAGITHQKSGYISGIARSIASGELDLERIATMEDDAARTELVELKGVGPWTADIYLLMALGRPDVWPSSDLALAQAMRQVKRLRAIPQAERQREISEAWRPWRAVSARLLWHHYLSAH